MVKNTKGGGNAKKAARKREADKDKLITPTEGQYIALVIKYLGRGMCNLRYIGSKKNDDGTSTTDIMIDSRGTVCGKNRRHIKQLPRGSLVLVSPRDFQKDIVDILTWYKEEQINSLKKLNMIDHRILTEMRALDANKLKAKDDDDDDEDNVNFACNENESNYLSNEKPGKSEKRRFYNQVDYTSLVLIPDDYKEEGENTESVDVYDDFGNLKLDADDCGIDLEGDQEDDFI